MYVSSAVKLTYMEKTQIFLSKGRAWRSMQGALRRRVAAQSWSVMRSARSYSNHGLQVRLLSGTASESMRPSIAIAFTISPDAAREAVFVDSGACIALALSRDPHMPRRESNGSCCTERARSFACHRHSRHFLIAMLTETWH